MHIIKRAWLAFSWIALAVAGSTAPGVVHAAGYPDKTIRMIVAYPPGGISDITARMVAPKLTEILGQSVVIENRGGAGGNVGAHAAAITAPDGYTYLVTTTSFAVNPALWGKDAGYNAEEDFVPVSLVSSQPNVIVVNDAIPAKTLADLKVLATQRPLGYATPGAGTTPALSADYLFQVVWKSNMTSIPYRGAGPAAVAVLGGETPVASVALASVLPYIKTGKVRALAVSSKERVASLPNVPTLAEQGFPNTDASNWYGLLAPAKTPAAVIAKLNDAVNAALNDPPSRDKLVRAGATPVGGTPESFGAFMKAEYEKWGRVVHDRGIKDTQ